VLICAIGVKRIYGDNKKMKCIEAKLSIVVFIGVIFASLAFVCNGNAAIARGSIVGV
jgi:hypothetical protein